MKNGEGGGGCRGHERRRNVEHAGVAGCFGQRETAGRVRNVGGKAEGRSIEGTRESGTEDVIVHAPAGADDTLACAAEEEFAETGTSFRGVSKRQPGRPVVQVVIQGTSALGARQIERDGLEASAAGQPGIGVGHAGVEPLAQGNAGAGLYAVLLVNGGPVHVAYAGGHRQLAGELPGVLEVDFRLLAAEVAGVGSALGQGTDLAVLGQIIVAGVDLGNQAEDRSDGIVKLGAAARVDAGGGIGGVDERRAQNLPAAGKPGRVTGDAEVGVGVAEAIVVEDTQATTKLKGVGALGVREVLGEVVGGADAAEGAVEPDGVGKTTKGDGRVLPDADVFERLAGDTPAGGGEKVAPQRSVPANGEPLAIGERLDVRVAAQKLGRAVLHVVLQLATDEEAVFIVEDVVELGDEGVVFVLEGGVEAIARGVDAIASRGVIRRGVGFEEVERRLVHTGCIAKAVGQFLRTHLDRGTGTADIGGDALT